MDQKQQNPPKKIKTDFRKITQNNKKQQSTKKQTKQNN